MANTALRTLNVDGELYRYRVRDYYDVYEGKLMIYAAQHKGGSLRVRFTTADRFAVFPAGVVFVWTGETGLPAIQQPALAVRVVRFARQQLGWQPQPHAPPLVIDKGYDLLRQLGYAPVPRPKPADA